MSLFENFPYTNLHNLNLDWLIAKLKELNDKFDEAIASGIKIADPPAWDITKAYEQLTIVFYDNGAYLSMQPVPPGTVITNTDYWQPVFDMSELYQDIEDLDQELNQKIDDAVDELNDSITTLDNTTVKNNSTKHILFVGDSYSTFYGGKLFSEFVRLCGVPAAQCHSVAVSGAGYTSAQTLTFLEEIQNYTGDKTEITDIIVCGGINDASIDFVSGDPIVARTRLTAAIDAFAAYCETNYPNARIHSAYVGGTMPTSQYYTTLHPYVSQEWALWAYTTYSTGKQFNVLKTWNAIHETPDNYNTDGIHPSEAYGCTAIAQAMASAFNGTPIFINRPQEILFYDYESYIYRSLQHFQRIINDTVIISTPGDYIAFNAGSILYANAWTPILAFRTLKVRCPMYLNCTVAIANFNNVSTPRVVPATLEIINGKIGIKVRSLSGNAYENLTANSGATITFLSFPDIVCPVWNCN